MTLARISQCSTQTDLLGRRPWSLWDMLKVKAKHYVEIGEGLANIVLFLNPPLTVFNKDAPLADDAQNYVLTSLAQIEPHCESLGLPVTDGLIEQFIGRYPPGTWPTYEQAFVAMSAIRDTFKLELQAQMFFCVLPHRTTYYSSAGPRIESGADIAGLTHTLEAFPDAKYDASEAGNCLAFERFTAAVYHLMRVAEYGLVAVAAAAGVESHDHRSWDKMIAGLHHHINLLSSQKLAANWKDEEKKYSDLVAWFTAIRNGWRNPVSHIPRIYTEDIARGMFVATKTLFERLHREGFTQIHMPVIPTLENPEDDV